jgi:hypothetical protein
MTTISRLMLFREIIGVYFENHTKPEQNVELLIVKAGGMCSYHWALKVNRWIFFRTIATKSRSSKAVKVMLVSKLKSQCMTPAV